MTRPRQLRTRWSALSAAVVLALLVGLVAAVTAPPDRLQGQLMRLMYVHVPAAWVAYLAFAVTFGASVGWLWRRDDRLDLVAAASAEVGVLFTGLAIVLGSIWAKPVWGVWWTWDPRLITTAVLLFVYLAYLGLRRATIERDARSRRSAIFGCLAFVQVPIVHLSVVWWRALHQQATVLRPGDPTMDHRMLAALLVNLLAFSGLYLVLLRANYRIGYAQDENERSAQEENEDLAGDAVMPVAMSQEVP